MATTKLSLKLFIDKKGQRVLFAEADKEFVDFLFTIFILPVGAVTSLLKEGGGMVGSLPSLYQSIENLRINHIFQPDESKRFLLEPMEFLPGAKLPFLLPNSVSTCRQFYRCSQSYIGCRNCVADYNSAICPTCDCKMEQKVGFVDPSGKIKASSCEEGYVKQTVTYMVMDDMEVKALSSTTLVPLLTKFNYTSDIEEKVVDVGMDEVCQSGNQPFLSVNYTTTK